MDNKKILNEVNRIKSVMGLLNENLRTKAAQRAISIIDDMVGISKNTLRDLTDTYGEEGVSLLKQLSDDTNTRGIGDIIEDMKKLPNPNTYDDVLTGLQLSLEKIVDANEISIAKKIEDIKKSVIELLGQGQKTGAADYFNRNFKNIANFGDESLENFIKDEWFFSSIDGFSKVDYIESLKLATEKIPKGIVGKALKFKDIIVSYSLKEEEIHAKIIKDIDKYKALKDEVKKLDAGDPNLVKAIEKANAYLSRVEFNLGLLNRKTKRTLSSIEEAVRKQMEDLPKKGPEYKKLDGLLKKVTKKDAKIEDLKQYFPNFVEFFKESAELMNSRKAALYRILPDKFNSKILRANPKVLEASKKLDIYESTWKVFSGDLFGALVRLGKDPKKLIRILGTETMSRIMSYPLKVAMIETTIDAAAWMWFNEDRVSPQFVEENPYIVKALSFANFDYMDYKNVSRPGDIGLNVLTKTFKNLGLTIPAAEVYNLWQKYFKKGGGFKWYDENIDKINILLKDSDFKNKSDEEKAVILQEIIKENETQLEKLLGFLDREPTVQELLNKALMEIEDVDNNNGAGESF